MTSFPARVLYVEANEDGTVGGSHRALVDLVLSVNRELVTPVVMFYQANRHVETLRAAGIEVHLFDSVRAKELETRWGGGLRKYLDYPGAVLRRRRFLEKHRIALVHLNNSLRVGFDDWLPAAKLTRIPCITFAMGDAVIHSRVIRMASRYFDHVIAISRYMLDAITVAGVPESRASLVHLGVDAEQLRSLASRPRASVRREFCVAESAVLVTMVGNIREWKGQRVVLEALAALPLEVRAPVRVLFVGAESEADSSYRAALDEFIQRNDLATVVRFTGGRDDVPSILAASDIAVHASIIPEPFGLVVPEAMAHGLPVIASCFGGPGEVLTEACGRTFDPANPAELAAHLTELLLNPELRQALGREARVQVEHFSVAAVTKHVESVYASLLEAV